MRRRQIVWAVILIGVWAGLSLPGSAVEGELQVTINEVELNPAGRDAGREWVEILNRSDEALDLEGWSLTFNYRADGTILLAESSFILGPEERFVFTYPELMLRNDANTVIQLLAPDGIVVDQTPAIDDRANDGQTWQRQPDGGDPLFPDFWVFGNGTKGAVNE